MKDMVEHTPGPYYVGTLAGGDFEVVPENTTSGRGIARVPNRADAELFAAAPELLVALERLIFEADNTGGSTREVSRYAVDNARAVVRRAIGR